MVYVTSEYRHTITPISVIDDLYGIVLSCLPEVSCYTRMGPCFILCSFAVTPVFITLPMLTLFSFLSGIVTSKIREKVPCFIYLLNNFSVTLFLSWGYLFVLFLYCRILLPLKRKTRTNQLFHFGILTTPSKITKSSISFVCVLVWGRSHIFYLKLFPYISSPSHIFPNYMAIIFHILWKYDFYSKPAIWCLSCDLGVVSCIL